MQTPMWRTRFTIAQDEDVIVELGEHHELGECVRKTSKQVEDAQTILSLAGQKAPHLLLPLQAEYWNTGTREYLTHRKLHTLPSRLPPQEAINVTLQIADAVSYLHDRGIIHADICPRNIFYSHLSGYVELFDLDHARRPGTPRMPLKGTCFPPEARAQQPLTTQSDVWMLGNLLYAGGTPHTKEVQEIIAKATRNKPEERYRNAADFRRALTTSIN